MALAGGGTFQYFQGCNIKLRNMSKEWLFCNEEDNVDPYRTTAGVIGGAVVFPPQGFTGTVGFVLQLDYVVEFQGQSLDVKSVVGVPSIAGDGQFRSDYGEVLMYTQSVTEDQVYVVLAPQPPTATGSDWADEFIEAVMEEYRYIRTVKINNDWYCKYFKNAADARTGQGTLALQRSVMPTVIGGAGKPSWKVELLNAP
jgi:hypothetical protein